MTTMLTWQADDGHALEGARLILGSTGLRALGRLVRVDTGGGFTASYRLVVGDDGTLSRLSLSSATAERERHLTINRIEDGTWLLDTGDSSGGTRNAFEGAVDVDVRFSPLFNMIPIRRHGLHREAGDYTVPIVHVSLPELEVQVVEKTYRTVSTLDEQTGHALIEYRSGDFTTELVVDADGIVASYPGLARRLVPGTAPTG